MFGRLRQVKNTSSSALVAEYRYNGLDFRIGWHYDTDTDGDVDSNDPWYSFAYDEAWRQVATFRGSDAGPKEVFIYHAALGYISPEQFEKRTAYPDTHYIRIIA